MASWRMPAREELLPYIGGSSGELAARIVALVVVGFTLLFLVSVAAPFLVALALAPRFLAPRHRRRVDALVALASAYALGHWRARRGGPPSAGAARQHRRVKVKGETYTSPADARAAARELLDRLADVPSEGPRFRELVDHAAELYTAAAEADR